MWFLSFTLFSHFIHIIFIFLSHVWARDPDPPSKVIFLSYSWSYFIHIIFILLNMPGLGPLSIPQSWKNICPHYFHILFILFSYFYHIFGLGTQISASKIIFWHIPGHICFTLFSYYWISLGWGPCPFRNLEKIFALQPQHPKCSMTLLPAPPLCTPALVRLENIWWIGSCMAAMLTAHLPKQQGQVLEVTPCWQNVKIISK